MKENGVSRAWIDSLYANSHCLHGCERINLWYPTPTPEKMELISKFKTMVKRATFHVFGDDLALMTLVFDEDPQ